MSHYVMIHTARDNRKTPVCFPSLKSAQIAAYRWKRSPKTKLIGQISFVPDGASAQTIATAWGVNPPNLDTICSEAQIQLQTEQQSWFQVWHYEATKAWNTFRYYVRELSL